MIRSVPIFLAVALLVAVMGIALMQSGALPITPMSLSTEPLGGLPTEVVSLGLRGGDK